MTSYLFLHSVPHQPTSHLKKSPSETWYHSAPRYCMSALIRNVADSISKAMNTAFPETYFLQEIITQYDDTTYRGRDTITGSLESWGSHSGPPEPTASLAALVPFPLPLHVSLFHVQLNLLPWRWKQLQNNGTYLPTYKALESKSLCSSTRLYITQPKMPSYLAIHTCSLSFKHPFNVHACYWHRVVW
jgi:hypothetical protein